MKTQLTCAKLRKHYKSLDEDIAYMTQEKDNAWHLLTTQNIHQRSNRGLVMELASYHSSLCRDIGYLINTQTKIRKQEFDLSCKGTYPIK